MPIFFSLLFLFCMLLIIAEIIKITWNPLMAIFNNNNNNNNLGKPLL